MPEDVWPAPYDTQGAQADFVPDIQRAQIFVDGFCAFKM